MSKELHIVITKDDDSGEWTAHTSDGKHNSATGTGYTIPEAIDSLRGAITDSTMYNYYSKKYEGFPPQNNTVIYNGIKCNCLKCDEVNQLHIKVIEKSEEVEKLKADNAALQREQVKLHDMNIEQSRKIKSFYGKFANIRAIVKGDA